MGATIFSLTKGNPMKLQALMIAAALVAGGAFAQTATGVGTGAAAGTSAAAPGTSTTTTNSPAFSGASGINSGSSGKAGTGHKKKVAKKHTMRKEQTSMGYSTQSMGAGPDVNLDSRSRERRMDQAYTDWQSRSAR
jgi:hypothetical protein